MFHHLFLFWINNLRWYWWNQNSEFIILKRKFIKGRNAYFQYVFTAVRLMFRKVDYWWKWMCLIWIKVFKNGPSKICGRRPLKNLKWYCLPTNFLKALFHKFYFVHSWIPQPIWCKITYNETIDISPPPTQYFVSIKIL